MTPNLLGLEWRSKCTRDVKTQTLYKDFPKEEAKIPDLSSLQVPIKKRRGRKPIIVTRVDIEAKNKIQQEQPDGDTEPQVYTKYP